MIEDEARVVAAGIQAKLGEDWIGELGNHGLHDAIWDIYEPYQDWTMDLQAEFFRLVYREIYG